MKFLRVVLSLYLSLSMALPPAFSWEHLSPASEIASPGSAVSMEMLATLAVEQGDPSESDLPSSKTRAAKYFLEQQLKKNKILACRMISALETFNPSTQDFSNDVFLTRVNDVGDRFLSIIRVTPEGGDKSIKSSTKIFLDDWPCTERVSSIEAIEGLIRGLSIGPDSRGVLMDASERHSLLRSLAFAIQCQQITSESKEQKNPVPVDPESSSPKNGNVSSGNIGEADHGKLNEQIRQTIPTRNRTGALKPEAETLLRWLSAGEGERLSEIVNAYLDGKGVDERLRHLTEDLLRISALPDFQLQFLEPVRGRMTFAEISDDGEPLEAKAHFGYQSGGKIYGEAKAAGKRLAEMAEEKNYPPSMYLASRNFETATKADKLALLLHEWVHLALGPGDEEHAIAEAIEKRGAILYDKLENASACQKVKTGMRDFYLLKQQMTSLPLAQGVDIWKEYLRLRSEMTTLMSGLAKDTHSLSVHTVESFFEELSGPGEIEEIHFVFGSREFLNLATPDFRKDSQIQDFIRQTMAELASEMPPEILKDYIPGETEEDRIQFLSGELLNIVTPVGVDMIFPDGDLLRSKEDRDDFARNLLPMLYGGKLSYPEGRDTSDTPKTTNGFLRGASAEASYHLLNRTIQSPLYQDRVHWKTALKHEAIHHLSNWRPKLGADGKPTEEKGRIVEFPAVHEDITMAVTLWELYKAEEKDDRCLIRFKNLFGPAVREIVEAGRQMVKEGLPLGDEYFHMVLIVDALRKKGLEEEARKVEQNPYEFGRYQGALLTGIMDELEKQDPSNKPFTTLVRYLKEKEKYRKKPFQERTDFEQTQLKAQVKNIRARVKTHFHRSAVLFQDLDEGGEGDWIIRDFLERVGHLALHADTSPLVPNDAAYGLGLCDLSVFGHEHSFWENLDGSVQESFENPLYRQLFSVLELPFTLTQGIAATGQRLRDNFQGQGEYLERLQGSGMAVAVNHYFQKRFEKNRVDSLFGRAMMSGLSLPEQFMESLLYRMVIGEKNAKGRLIDPRKPHPVVEKALQKTAGSKTTPNGWLYLMNKSGHLSFEEFQKILNEVILPVFKELEETEKKRKEILELYLRAKSEEAKKELQNMKLSLENQGESGLRDGQKKAMNETLKKAWDDMSKEEREALQKRLAEEWKEGATNPKTGNPDDFNLPLPLPGQAAGKGEAVPGQSMPPSPGAKGLKQSVKDLQGAIKNLKDKLNSLQGQTGAASDKASRAPNGFPGKEIRDQGEAIGKASATLPGSAKSLSNKASQVEGQIDAEGRQGQDVRKAKAGSTAIGKQAADNEGKAGQAAKLGQDVKRLTGDLGKMLDEGADKQPLDSKAGQVRGTLEDLTRILDEMQRLVEGIQKDAGEVEQNLGEGKPQPGTDKPDGEPGKEGPEGEAGFEEGVPSEDVGNLQAQATDTEKDPSGVTPQVRGTPKAYKAPAERGDTGFSLAESDALLNEKQFEASGMSRAEWEFFNLLMPPEGFRDQLATDDFYKAVIQSLPPRKSWKKTGSIKSRGVVRAVKGQAHSQRKKERDQPAYRLALLLDLSGSMFTPMTEEIEAWKKERLEKLPGILLALKSELGLDEKASRAYELLGQALLGQESSIRTGLLLTWVLMHGFLHTRHLLAQRGDVVDFGFEVGYFKNQYAGFQDLSYDREEAIDPDQFGKVILDSLVELMKNAGGGTQEADALNQCLSRLQGSLDPEQLATAKAGVFMITDVTGTMSYEGMMKVVLDHGGVNTEKVKANVYLLPVGEAAKTEEVWRVAGDRTILPVDPKGDPLSLSDLLKAVAAAVREDFQAKEYRLPSGARIPVEKIRALYEKLARAYREGGSGTIVGGMALLLGLSPQVIHAAGQSANVLSALANSLLPMRLLGMEEVPENTSSRKRPGDRWPLFPGSKNFEVELDSFGREWLIFKKFVPPRLEEVTDASAHKTLRVIEEGRWVERRLPRTAGSDPKKVPSFPEGIEEIPSNIDLLWEMFEKAFPEDGDVDQGLFTRDGLTYALRGPDGISLMSRIPGKPWHETHLFPLKKESFRNPPLNNGELSLSYTVKGQAVTNLLPVEKKGLRGTFRDYWFSEEKNTLYVLREVKEPGEKTRFHMDLWVRQTDGTLVYEGESLHTEMRYTPRKALVLEGPAGTAKTTFTEFFSFAMNEEQYLLSGHGKREESDLSSSDTLLKTDQDGSALAETGKQHSAIIKAGVMGGNLNLDEWYKVHPNHRTVTNSWIQNWAVPWERGDGSSYQKPVYPRMRWFETGNPAGGEHGGYPFTPDEMSRREFIYVRYPLPEEEKRLWIREARKRAAEWGKKFSPEQETQLFDFISQLVVAADEFRMRNAGFLSEDITKRQKELDRTRLLFEAIGLVSPKGKEEEGKWDEVSLQDPFKVTPSPIGHQSPNPALGKSDVHRALSLRVLKEIVRHFTLFPEDLEKRPLSVLHRFYNFDMESASPSSVDFVHQRLEKIVQKPGKTWDYEEPGVEKEQPGFDLSDLSKTLFIEQTPHRPTGRQLVLRSQNGFPELRVDIAPNAPDSIVDNDYAHMVSSQESLLHLYNLTQDYILGANVLLIGPEGTGKSEMGLFLMTAVFGSHFGFKQVVESTEADALEGAQVVRQGESKIVAQETFRAIKNKKGMMIDEYGKLDDDGKAVFNLTLAQRKMVLLDGQETLAEDNPKDKVGPGLKFFLLATSNQWHRLPAEQLERFRSYYFKPLGKVAVYQGLRKKFPKVNPLLFGEEVYGADGQIVDIAGGLVSFMAAMNAHSEKEFEKRVFGFRQLERVITGLLPYETRRGGESLDQILIKKILENFPIKENQKEMVWRLLASTLAIRNNETPRTRDELQRAYKALTGNDLTGAPVLNGAFDVSGKLLPTQHEALLRALRNHDYPGRNLWPRGADGKLLAPTIPEERNKIEAVLKQEGLGPSVLEAQLGGSLFLDTLMKWQWSLPKSDPQEWHSLLRTLQKTRKESVVNAAIREMSRKMELLLGQKVEGTSEKPWAELSFEEKLPRMSQAVRVYQVLKQIILDKVGHAPSVFESLDKQILATVERVLEQVQEWDPALLEDERFAPCTVLNESEIESAEPAELEAILKEMLPQGFEPWLEDPIQETLGRLLLFPREAMTDIHEAKLIKHLNAYCKDNVNRDDSKPLHTFIASALRIQEVNRTLQVLSDQKELAPSLLKKLSDLKAVGDEFLEWLKDKGMPEPYSTNKTPILERLEELQKDAAYFSRYENLSNSSELDFLRETYRVSLSTALHLQDVSGNLKPIFEALLVRISSLEERQKIIRERESKILWKPGKAVVLKDLQNIFSVFTDKKFNEKEADQVLAKLTLDEKHPKAETIQSLQSLYEQLLAHATKQSNDLERISPALDALLEKIAELEGQNEDDNPYLREAARLEREVEDLEAQKAELVRQIEKAEKSQKPTLPSVSNAEIYKFLQEEAQKEENIAKQLLEKQKDIPELLFEWGQTPGNWDEELTINRLALAQVYSQKPEDPKFLKKLQEMMTLTLSTPGLTWTLLMKESAILKGKTYFDYIKQQMEENDLKNHPKFAREYIRLLAGIKGLTVTQLYANEHQLLKDLLGLCTSYDGDWNLKAQIFRNVEGLDHNSLKRIDSQTNDWFRFHPSQNRAVEEVDTALTVACRPAVSELDDFSLTSPKAGLFKMLWGNDPATWPTSLPHLYASIRGYKVADLKDNSADTFFPLVEGKKWADLKPEQKALYLAHISSFEGWTVDKLKEIHILGTDSKTVWEAFVEDITNSKTPVPTNVPPMWEASSTSGQVRKDWLDFLAKVQGWTWAIVEKEKIGSESLLSTVMDLTRLIQDETYVSYLEKSLPAIRFLHSLPPLDEEILTHPVHFYWREYYGDESDFSVENGNKSVEEALRIRTGQIPTAEANAAWEEFYKKIKVTPKTVASYKETLHADYLGKGLPIHYDFVPKLYMIAENSTQDWDDLRVEQWAVEGRNLMSIREVLVERVLDPTTDPAFRKALLHWIRKAIERSIQKQRGLDSGRSLPRATTRGPNDREEAVIASEARQSSSKEIQALQSQLPALEAEITRKQELAQTLREGSATLTREKEELRVLEAQKAQKAEAEEKARLEEEARRKAEKSALSNADLYRHLKAKSDKGDKDAKEVLTLEPLTFEWGKTPEDWESEFTNEYVFKAKVISDGMEKNASADSGDLKTLVDKVLSVPGLNWDLLTQKMARLEDNTCVEYIGLLMQRYKTHPAIAREWLRLLTSAKGLTWEQLIKENGTFLKTLLEMAKGLDDPKDLLILFKNVTGIPDHAALNKELGERFKEDSSLDSIKKAALPYFECALGETGRDYLLPQVKKLFENTSLKFNDEQEMASLLFDMAPIKLPRFEKQCAANLFRDFFPEAESKVWKELNAPHKNLYLAFLSSFDGWRVEDLKQIKILGADSPTLWDQFLNELVKGKTFPEGMAWFRFMAKVKGLNPQSLSNTIPTDNTVEELSKEASYLEVLLHYIKKSRISGDYPFRVACLEFLVSIPGIFEFQDVKKQLEDHWELKKESPMQAVWEKALQNLPEKTPENWETNLHTHIQNWLNMDEVTSEPHDVYTMASYSQLTLDWLLQPRKFQRSGKTETHSALSIIRDMLNNERDPQRYRALLHLLRRAIERSIRTSDAKKENVEEPSPLSETFLQKHAETVATVSTLQKGLDELLTQIQRQREIEKQLALPKEVQTGTGKREEEIPVVKPSVLTFTAENFNNDANKAAKAEKQWNGIMDELKTVLEDMQNAGEKRLLNRTGWNTAYEKLFTIKDQDWLSNHRKTLPLREDVKTLFSFEDMSQRAPGDYGKIILDYANLWGIDLRGAYLYSQELRGVDLYGTKLHGADLRGADLQGARLDIKKIRGASFYAKDLEVDLLKKMLIFKDSQWVALETLGDTRAMRSFMESHGAFFTDYNKAIQPIYGNETDNADLPCWQAWKTVNQDQSSFDSIVFSKSFAGDTAKVKNPLTPAPSTPLRTGLFHKGARKLTAAEHETLLEEMDSRLRGNDRRGGGDDKGGAAKAGIQFPSNAECYRFLLEKEKTTPDVARLFESSKMPKHEAFPLCADLGDSLQDFKSWCQKFEADTVLDWTNPANRKPALEIIRVLSSIPGLTWDQLIHSDTDFSSNRSWVDVIVPMLHQSTFNPEFSEITDALVRLLTSVNGLRLDHLTGNGKVFSRLLELLKTNELTQAHRKQLADCFLHVDDLDIEKLKSSGLVKNLLSEAAASDSEEHKNLLLRGVWNLLSRAKLGPEHVNKRLSFDCLLWLQEQFGRPVPDSTNLDDSYYRFLSGVNAPQGLIDALFSPGKTYADESMHSKLCYLSMLSGLTGDRAFTPQSLKEKSLPMPSSSTEKIWDTFKREILDPNSPPELKIAWLHFLSRVQGWTWEELREEEWRMSSDASGSLLGFFTDNVDIRRQNEPEIRKACLGFFKILPAPDLFTLDRNWDWGYKWELEDHEGVRAAWVDFSENLQHQENLGYTEGYSVQSNTRKAVSIYLAAADSKVDWDWLSSNDLLRIPGDPAPEPVSSLKPTWLEHSIFVVTAKNTDPVLRRAHLHLLRRAIGRSIHKQGMDSRLHGNDTLSAVMPAKAGIQATPDSLQQQIDEIHSAQIPLQQAIEDLCDAQKKHRELVEKKAELSAAKVTPPPPPTDPKSITAADRVAYLKTRTDEEAKKLLQQNADLLPLCEWGNTPATWKDKLRKLLLAVNDANNREKERDIRQILSISGLTWDLILEELWPDEANGKNMLQFIHASIQTFPGLRNEWSQLLAGTQDFRTDHLQRDDVLETLAKICNFTFDPNAVPHHQNRILELFSKLKMDAEQRQSLPALLEKVMGYFIGGHWLIKMHLYSAANPTEKELKEWKLDDEKSCWEVLRENDWAKSDLTLGSEVLLSSLSGLEVDTQTNIEPLFQVPPTKWESLTPEQKRLHLAYLRSFKGFTPENLKTIHIFGPDSPTIWEAFGLAIDMSAFTPTELLHAWFEFVLQVPGWTWEKLHSKDFEIKTKGWGVRPILGVLLDSAEKGMSAHAQAQESYAPIVRFLSRLPDFSMESMSREVHGYMRMVQEGPYMGMNHVGPLGPLAYSRWFYASTPELQQAWEEVFKRMPLVDAKKAMQETVTLFSVLSTNMNQIENLPYLYFFASNPETTWESLEQVKLPGGTPLRKILVQALTQVKNMPSTTRRALLYLLEKSIEHSIEKLRGMDSEPADPFSALTKRIRTFLEEKAKDDPRMKEFLKGGKDDLQNLCKYGPLWMTWEDLENDKALLNFLLDTFSTDDWSPEQSLILEFLRALPGFSWEKVKGLQIPKNNSSFHSSLFSKMSLGLEDICRFFESMPGFSPLDAGLISPVYWSKLSPEQQERMARLFYRPGAYATEKLKGHGNNFRQCWDLAFSATDKTWKHRMALNILASLRDLPWIDLLKNNQGTPVLKQILDYCQNPSLGDEEKALWFKILQNAKGEELSAREGTVTLQYQGTCSYPNLNAPDAVEQCIQKQELASSRGWALSDLDLMVAGKSVKQHIFEDLNKTETDFLTIQTKIAWLHFLLNVEGMSWEALENIKDDSGKSLLDLIFQGDMSLARLDFLGTLSFPTDWSSPGRMEKLRVLYLLGNSGIKMNTPEGPQIRHASAKLFLKVEGFTARDFETTLWADRKLGELLFPETEKDKLSLLNGSALPALYWLSNLEGLDFNFFNLENVATRMWEDKPIGQRYPLADAVRDELDKTGNSDNPVLDPELRREALRHLIRTVIEHSLPPKIVTPLISNEQIKILDAQIQTAQSQSQSAEARLSSLLAQTKMVALIESEWALAKTGVLSQQLSRESLLDFLGTQGSQGVKVLSALNPVHPLLTSSEEEIRKHIQDQVDALKPEEITFSKLEKLLPDRGEGFPVSILEKIQKNGVRVLELCLKNDRVIVLVDETLSFVSRLSGWSLEALQSYPHSGQHTLLSLFLYNVSNPVSPQDLPFMDWLVRIAGVSVDRMGQVSLTQGKTLFDFIEDLFNHSTSSTARLVYPWIHFLSRLPGGNDLAVLKRVRFGTEPLLEKILGMLNRFPLDAQHKRVRENDAHQELIHAVLCFLSQLQDAPLEVLNASVQLFQQSVEDQARNRASPPKITTLGAFLLEFTSFKLNPGGVSTVGQALGDQTFECLKNIQNLTLDTPIPGTTPSVTLRQWIENTRSTTNNPHALFELSAVKQGYSKEFLSQQIQPSTSNDDFISEQLQTCKNGRDLLNWVELALTLRGADALPLPFSSSLALGSFQVIGGFNTNFVDRPTTLAGILYKMMTQETDRELARKALEVALKVPGMRSSHWDASSVMTSGSVLRHILMDVICSRSQANADWKSHYSSALMGNLEDFDLDFLFKKQAVFAQGGTNKFMSPWDWLQETRGFIATELQAMMTKLKKTDISNWRKHPEYLREVLKSWEQACQAQVNPSERKRVNMESLQMAHSVFLAGTPLSPIEECVRSPMSELGNRSPLQLLFSEIKSFLEGQRENRLESTVETLKLFSCFLGQSFEDLKRVELEPGMTLLDVVKGPLLQLMNIDPKFIPEGIKLLNQFEDISWEDVSDLFKENGWVERVFKEAPQESAVLFEKAIRNSLKTQPLKDMKKATVLERILPLEQQKLEALRLGIMTLRLFLGLPAEIAKPLQTSIDNTISSLPELKAEEALDNATYIRIVHAVAPVFRNPQDKQLQAKALAALSKILPRVRPEEILAVFLRKDGESLGDPKPGALDLILKNREEVPKAA